MCYVWNVLARIHVLQLLMYPWWLHPSQLCLCELTGLWQQGSKQHVNQPWHRPPSKQVSSHDKAPIATSQGVRCVMSGAGHSVCVSAFVSLSHTTMANALVSHCVTLWCCWIQLAFSAATETKREPTWTLRFVFRSRESSKPLQTLLLFFLSFFL